MLRAATDLIARAATDPASPWLTDVDLATGERTELSVASAANGVAKAAHLVGSLEAAHGDQVRVGLRLPTHWQTVTLVLGCWLAGATVVLGEEPVDVDAVVLGPTSSARLPEDLPDVVWASRLHAFGLPFDVPPAYPVEDLALALREQPDRPPPARPGAVGLVLPGPGPADEALRRRTDELEAELDPSVRLLTTWPLDTVDGLAAAVTVPASGARSVVLVRDGAGDNEALTALCASERVTVTAGVEVRGVPHIT